MAAVSLKNISKSFVPQVPVLDDLSLEVKQGELFFLLGPSGCGKSTLLRILAGLEKQDHGEIYFDGAEISSLPPEKRQEYAAAISQTTRRLADMVSNILKLNRLENQKIFPETKVFDLGEQLAQCLLEFETVWEKKKLELNCDIADDVQVSADPELLHLVWINLFSNAMKFTPEGGAISVSLTEQDGWATVRVSDTGCGMTQETGAHIFEKFYQGDTAHAAKGNGLGLALVKRVVDITGGKIAVRSTLGSGSTFTVQIRSVKHGAG